MRPLNHPSALEAWNDAVSFKVRIEARETLRKAHFAWANPDGRESIDMAIGEVIGLLVIAAITGLMMGWIGA